MSCITYYVTCALGGAASATLIQAACLVTPVSTTLVICLIDRKLGRKKTMILGVAAAIGGKLWFPLDPFSIGVICLNAITVGFSAAVAVAFVIFNTNRNNIVDIVEWNDGRRLDSPVSTADNLASKLVTAGASELVAVLLSSKLQCRAGGSARTGAGGH
jgi:Na+/melibiose symporter-like transporter